MGGGGLFDNEGDCHFGNLRPDWEPEGPENNPELSLDDVDGYGPEVIELAQPLIDSEYGIVVHYFSDDGFGETEATLRIFINGEPYRELTQLLQANEVWDIGNLHWEGATGTLSLVDTVTSY
jgi:hypothetical protein